MRAHTAYNFKTLVVRTVVKSILKAFGKAPFMRIFLMTLGSLFISLNITLAADDSPPVCQSDNPDSYCAGEAASKVNADKKLKGKTGIISEDTAKKYGITGTSVSGGIEIPARIYLRYGQTDADVRSCIRQPNLALSVGLGDLLSEFDRLKSDCVKTERLKEDVKSDREKCKEDKTQLEEAESEFRAAAKKAQINCDMSVGSTDCEDKMNKCREASPDDPEYCPQIVGERTDQYKTNLDDTMEKYNDLLKEQKDKEASDQDARNNIQGQLADLEGELQKLDIELLGLVTERNNINRQYADDIESATMHRLVNRSKFETEVAELEIEVDTLATEKAQKLAEAQKARIDLNSSCWDEAEIKFNEQRQKAVERRRTGRGSKTSVMAHFKGYKGKLQDRYDQWYRNFFKKCLYGPKYKNGLAKIEVDVKTLENTYQQKKSDLARKRKVLNQQREDQKVSELTQVNQNERKFAAALEALSIKQVAIETAKGQLRKQMELAYGQLQQLSQPSPGARGQEFMQQFQIMEALTNAQFQYQTATAQGDFSGLEPGAVADATMAYDSYRRKQLDYQEDCVVPDATGDVDTVLGDD